MGFQCKLKGCLPVITLGPKKAVFSAFSRAKEGSTRVGIGGGVEVALEVDWGWDGRRTGDGDAGGWRLPWRWTGDEPEPPYGVVVANN